MKSRIDYVVSKLPFDYETKKYNTTICGRTAMVTIYGKTKEKAERCFESLDDYIKLRTKYRFSDCPAIEQEKNGLWSYTDSISVDDKEEFIEVKELYLKWKRGVLILW